MLSIEQALNKNEYGAPAELHSLQWPAKPPWVKRDPLGANRGAKFMKSREQVIEDMQFSGSGEQLIRDIGYPMSPGE